MRTRCVLVLCSLIAAGCEGALPTPPFRDGALAPIDADIDPHLALEFDAVEPSHGSFAGGDRVVLRGSGLALGSVTFGGVAATDVQFVDAHRIAVTTPPGPPGAVDVTIDAGEGPVLLAGGYLYDALEVTPSVGSPAGGTWVTIRAGVAIDPSVNVLFADAACTGVSVDADTVRCFTPPGEIGPVTVTLGDTTAIDAFTYESPTIVDGGTGGGPLAGTLEITVMDDHGPIAGAAVLAGVDLASLETAHTDAQGLVTFAGPAFATGPVDVHVGTSCGRLISYLAVRSRRLTALADCDVGSAPGASPVFVSGHVDTLGWEGVPSGTRAVHMTVVGYGDTAALPGTNDRIASGQEAAGYRLAVAPGAYAIVALAGIEDADGVLTPFRMGIAREVDVSHDHTGVDLALDIPLDQSLRVTIAAPDDGGTDTVDATLEMDEGTLDRSLSDPATGSPPTLTISAEPMLTGSLSDAHFRVVASHVLGSGSSERLVTTAGPSVTLDAFLGVPAFVTPTDGASFTHRLAWTNGVGAPGAITTIDLDSSDFSWAITAPGDATSAQLPSFAALGVDAPTGMVSAQLLRIAGDFDYAAYSPNDFGSLASEAQCSVSFVW